MKSPTPGPGRPRPPLFWYQVFSLLALTVLIAGVGGLGLVFLRQQITDTAARIKQVQGEKKQVDDRLEYLGARIAELQRPDVLRGQALAMGLSLRRPETYQIVRMGPLILPSWSDVVDPAGQARDPAEPHRQTFDLAVVEPLNPVGR